MTETLVLGNGISRLSYIDIIKNWLGEVWGCNLAFLDFPDKLNRITGHANVMLQAKEYREKYRHDFEIWGGNLGANIATDKKFDCPEIFRRDSGTTMLAQALHEGRNIAVCGFDLGGPDIHSPGIENQLKHNWIQRWRKLFEVYDHKRVRFIGYDHKPYLFSGRSSMQYSQRYRNGKPHIIDPDYMEAWEQWTGKKYEHIDFGGETVKVKYKHNGYVATVSEGVAAKLIDKGKAELVKEVKPKEETEPVLTKKQIIAKLEEMGVEYDKKSKVVDLLKVLEEAEE